jgi:hypothetical protein
VFQVMTVCSKGATTGGEKFTPQVGSSLQTPAWHVLPGAQVPQLPPQPFGPQTLPSHAGAHSVTEALHAVTCPAAFSA